MTRRRSIPYLHVVGRDDSAPLTEFVPTMEERDLLILEHWEEIHVHYTFWMYYNGPFLPDDELKRRGLIPLDWSRSQVGPVSGYDVPLPAPTFPSE